MPPLTLIKILGNAKFFSDGLKLPVKWDEKFYKDHNPEPGEQGNAPKTIPPWFMAEHPGYRYQQKSCDDIGKNFKDFHDTILDAVSFAHQMWCLQAKIKGINIMAVAAVGPPGSIDGPELESLIKSAPAVASWSGNMAKHRDAVAKGVSKCFKDWQGQVAVPGLPWYPAFAAFPSAMAPPMPNIPVPLIMCPSAKITSLVMPDDMTKAMDDALDGGLKDKDPSKQYHALHDAIATVLSLAFLLWMVQQQVMLVLGKGPIPSFAPPFVPVGPVVGGAEVGTPNFMA